ncbi:ABC transporter ATP-binding protein [Actinomadura spongiicola]|uniref:ABC transporter ATP-binding protein n=1 Tax=Actinomadura spongiicola TaxID=2303421 RepID=A0A372GQ07_9ACTN|nr:ABC transporter ATP-binding protein [Actinomadura spongiicola]RFS87405.1 ABC transporter ATP-binding protein [Actinomadura spongiicola]
MATRTGGDVTGTVAEATGAAGSEDAASVVRTRGLTKKFGARTVLDGVDLDIERGEFVALLGRSGSGKSTLLRLLAGLDRDSTGDLHVDGTVSVAFQEPRLVPWKRVLDNVTLGLRGSDPVAAAERALAEVELTERRDRWPLTLSGGEAQRVSLARALVRNPDLLLLDEPFSALDALTRINVHRLVLDLWARHRPGVLLVTHDVDEALLLADRVLVLDGGRIAHQSTVGLPRPRAREDRELIELRSVLLARLGVTLEGTT